MFPSTFQYILINNSIFILTAIKSLAEIFTGHSKQWERNCRHPAVVE